ncbi:MAG: CPBP family glutamic-type intramembrane protease, partial [Candidatus Heimdallarchaeaceae archaeon]
FQLIYTLAMGFFFAYLTIKSKSLLPVIISHYLIDGFGSLFQLVYYVNQELFLAFQTFFGIGILASVINITLLKLIPNKWFSEQEIKKSALFFEE